MRHVFLSLFFSFFSSLCIAQNLVPNPSFEDTVSCFTTAGSIEKARYWYKVEESPDYFHECVSNSFLTVPENDFGFQYAATGQAYCGFLAYSTADTVFVEKLGVDLLNPLIIGSKYFVSFKVNLANRHGGTFGGCNKLGMLFTKTSYSDINSHQISKTNRCQVWTDEIITDSINWVIVSGSFVADSEYTKIIIGSFFYHAQKDTIRTRFPNPDQGWGLESYYFIDDVCVSEDSTTCADNTTSIVSIMQNQNKVLVAYPNPATNYFTIETETDEPSMLECYSLSGQILLRQKIPRGRFTFNQDVSEIANGIYFLKLITNNQILSQKIIINH